MMNFFERKLKTSAGEAGKKIFGSGKNLREKIFLAEQAAEGRIKVFPGKEWSVHFPVPEKERQEKIRGLQEGKYSAEEVEKYLKPDAILYSLEDLEKKGLEYVSAKILDITSTMQHYDYHRFADFISTLKESDADFETTKKLYDGIIKPRIQKKMRDAFGPTGKRQMDSALRAEAEQTMEEIDKMDRMGKIFSTLKTDWLCEEMGQIGTEKRDMIQAKLSGEEREVLQKVAEDYRKYVQSGDEEAYKNLVRNIKDSLPAIERKKTSADSEKAGKELEKELEKYKEEAGLPGTDKDPAITPEDSDEYHTPDAPKGESKEKIKERHIFEIQPALAGFYAGGRKSYFDIDRKTWSKKKKITEFSGSNIKGQRRKISGAADAGLRSIPLPNSFVLDAATLKCDGKAKLFRDQNGCFYIEAENKCAFEIDFGKEENLFTGNVVKEDMDPIYRGNLSAKTEKMIAKLMGGPAQKAEQVRQYILANHFYPGGGDLESAQALQLKLRKESTGDNYAQNLDASSYLECYSANTLFVAMMRASGVPARLVTGYRVEGETKGKTKITPSSGHAWSEIWDGKVWRRFDATPEAKPEDKKKDGDKDGKEKQNPAEEADDGGVENPQKKNDQQSEEGEKGEKRKSDQSQSGEMKEATDGEVKEGEKQVQEAKEKMEAAQKAKEQVEKQLDETKSFQEIEKMKDEIKKAEMFDEMKEDLEKKLEAVKEQMMEELKDGLDKMVDDGFLDEDKRDELEKIINEEKLKELDRLKKQIEEENKLYEEYENIRAEIMPLVDEWYEYFISRLPRQDEIENDEDSLSRQGTFNKRSVNKARNLIFGRIKNPRIIRSTAKPLFLSSIMVDVSGSMAGTKLENARKLLVFYCELFSRIQENFGYIRFSINIFSDNMKEIKNFDHDYNSPRAYDFSDRSKSTIKVRLMKAIVTSGGTNMLDPIKKAAKDLSEQTFEYPDYASAFYFIGDGGDTCGNGGNIKKFLELKDSERGFGEHLLSAIMLGNESQRKELADIFGDEATTVAPDMESLIEESMKKFDDDIGDYLNNKV